MTIRHADLHPNEVLTALNDELTKALSNKDKKAILRLYEEAKDIDLDNVSNYIFEAYEELVNKCNDLLYS
jgi:hypothetical protein